MFDARPLEKATLSSILRLEVAPEQRVFVATAPVTVAQSMFEPASEVFGLWDGEAAVGLIGMIDFTRPDADLVEGEEPDNFYLWRLLIDQGQQRQGYGINQTPQQQAAEQRRTNVERSASMVSAGNEARISAQDRQDAILAGGMGLSNIPDQVMNQ